MKKSGFVLLICVLSISITMVGGSVHADDVVANVENTGSTLVFHPVVDYEELTLVVVGPCDYLHKQVVTDGSPYFRLGQETIDGAYTYQLTVTPAIAADVIAVLRQSRKTGDDSGVRALCREGRLPGPPKTQTAGFTVAGGVIVYDPLGHEGKEKDLAGAMTQQNQSPMTITVDSYQLAVPGDQGKAAKDYVIMDDLIVDGSACVGFDCVNGESFGFDTLRLKENNLRIDFDDTSTAASFPRNDWKLVANDSANGGGDHFSILDVTNSNTVFTVEANARAHSLHVDDYGRVGYRTATPSVEQHIVDGDTPTVRLDQDGNSGWAEQVWDVAGNETNFFVRDVTNGSTLPFRIMSDADNSSLVIGRDGNVGIGTASPEAPLHILNNGAVKLTLDNIAESAWNLNSSADGDFRISDDDETANTELSLSPDGDLEISGSLTASGTTFPDYVFEPSYQLMPLNELAEFIAANRHLPNVPSAEDAEGGRRINMTELQIRLLEKVEELTLYTLAQQKAVDRVDELSRLCETQQQTIEELQARLAALEGTVE